MLSSTVTLLQYAFNRGLLTSECSMFKNPLQIQPKLFSLFMEPSFLQHLSKFSQHKQNSMYISNPNAFLIIEAAQFGCCKMKSLISAMEIFGLPWSFFKSSIQLKNRSPYYLTKSRKKKFVVSSEQLTLYANPECSII
jgi:hypothetical protein